MPEILTMPESPANPQASEAAGAGPDWGASSCELPCPDLPKALNLGLLLQS